MSKVSQYWHNFKAWVQGEGKHIDAVIAPDVQEIYKDLMALAEQIVNTIGTQAYSVAKKSLQLASTEFLAGKDKGQIISDVVVEAKKDVVPDLQEDAKNASYGAVAAILAALSNTRAVSDVSVAPAIEAAPPVAAVVASDAPTLTVNVTNN